MKYYALSEWESQFPSPGVCYSHYMLHCSCLSAWTIRFPMWTELTSIINQLEKATMVMEPHNLSAPEHSRHSTVELLPFRPCHMSLQRYGVSSLFIHLCSYPLSQEHMCFLDYSQYLCAHEEWTYTICVMYDFAYVHKINELTWRSWQEK